MACLRPDAYLSISVPGFPNFFLLNGPNGPVGNFSLIEVAELQIAYILQLVELLRGGGWWSWYLDDRGIPAVWPWTFDRFREEMARPRLEAWTRTG